MNFESETSARLVGVPRLMEELRTSTMLVELNRLAETLIGLRFLFVVPRHDGWDQFTPGTPDARSDFCRTIQSVEEGRRNCAMCHILMAGAARGPGTKQQQCHAGPFVLAKSMEAGTGRSGCVLSSCALTHMNRARVWQHVQARGRKLGLDLRRLSQDFQRLAVLSPEQMETAKILISITSQAASEAETRYRLERELQYVHGTTEESMTSQVALKLRLTPDMLQNGRSGRGGRHLNPVKHVEATPALVRVVGEMVAEQPYLPFTVKTIAAAARVTASHFSSTFRRCYGKRFTDYLSSARLHMAKHLLGDLTLNIAEVSRRCGFADPNYFTRHFTRQTGYTPRHWRNRYVNRHPVMQG